MPTNRITHLLPSPGDASRIIVTGGAGFIGSHLVDFFLQKDFRVIAIDDLSTGYLDNLQIANESTNFQFVQADVCKLDWSRLLEPTDIVLHLAASVGVKKVCESPLKTAHNNHLPVEQILNTMLEKGGGRFLYASTSEVYGNSPGQGSSEQDFLQVHTHLGGRSAYTVSKLYGELITKAYGDAYGIPVTILRFFNTIGTRQRSEYGMVVPIFVQQALAGEPITVFGEGKQTRSFCAVNDLVEAVYGLTTAANAAGRIYNIGNPEQISILELAQFIKAETGSSSPIHLLPYPAERAGKTDIQARKPDIARIHSELGWRPSTNWKQTVRTIIHEQMMIVHDQCVYH